MEKSVYIATSAMTVGVSANPPHTVTKKSGGVAPGISNAVPEGFKTVGWLGIGESPGSPEKEAAMNAALNAWGQGEGLGESQNELLFVNKNMFKSFYTGATNGKMWPLMHSMPEKVTPRGSFGSHTEVDKLYTEKLLDKIDADIANPDKPEIGSYKDVVVWAHDYHVFQVPGMLKELAQERNPDGGDINVSFFHHETWAELAPSNGPKAPEGNKIFTGLNESDNNAFKEILSNLIQADTIGFHTQEDVDNFVKTIQNFEVLTNEKDLKVLEEKCFANPIGIPKHRITQEFEDRSAVLTAGLNNVGELTPEQQDRTASFRAGLATAIAAPEIAANADLQAAATRIQNGGAYLHDLQSVKEKELFDPNKIHMGSVQRFDYTKGIQEFLEGYRTFLTDKRAANPAVEPGSCYQYNLCTGRGRSNPIPAYDEYQKKVEATIKEINAEFPGAIHHYQNGIDNAEVPVFGGMNDLPVATSVKDGYILSIGEMINARELTLKQATTDGVDPLVPHKATAVIVSNGAGIAEDLGGLERQSTIDTLSIVDPSAEAITEALHAQIDRIEDLRVQNPAQAEQLAENKAQLSEMSGKITNADTTFGQNAFAMIDASLPKSRFEGLATTQDTRREDLNRAGRNIKRAARKKQKTGPGL